MSFDERNLRDIKVFIDGPNNSAYQGATYEIDVHFAKRFPSQPPTVRFKTQIFHLNITNSGRIFLDTLHSNWNPGKSTLGDIIVGIIGMLENGGENKNHPLNETAALFYNDSVAKYRQEAARQTQQFSEQNTNDTYYEDEKKEIDDDKLKFSHVVLCLLRQLLNCVNFIMINSFHCLNCV